MIEPVTRFVKDKNDILVIFDVGSRDCQQSIEFYHNFPKAKIFAFECNPNTLPLCRKNIEKYQDRITLVEGAVTDYDGEITFYPINQEKTVTTWKDGNPGASSLFKSNGTYVHEKYVQDEIKTNCHRLDTIMKKYNIDKVDLIWMDLQGAELLALKSLGHYMKNVKVIYTEVSHKPIYEGQVMFDELNNFIISNGFILRNNLSMGGWQEDALYEKKYDFDIVIAIGPKDLNIFKEQIRYNRRNVIGYRNIYVISKDKIDVEGCKYYSEDIFPFSIETVATYHGKNNRNGWYLQQLIKLYAGKCIPGIMDRYLVIDADTFFMEPLEFVKNDKPLYSHGTEYNKPYFDHMLALDSSFTRSENVSGICHHMLFENKYLKEIKAKVKATYKDKFYNIFLKLVDKSYFTAAGASEYELYFHYMVKFHSSEIIRRPLKWKNAKYSDLNSKDYQQLSIHWHMN